MAATWGDLGAAVGGNDSSPPATKSTYGAAFEVACALQAKKNPDLRDYMCCMASLMTYLKSNQNDVFKAILPLLNANPFIAFYTIVMPFSIVEKGRLVSEKTIGDWWGQCNKKISSNVSDAAKTYLDLFNVDLKALYDECGIQLKAAQDEIDKFQRKIKSSPPVTAPEKVIEIYDELVSVGSGSLGGVQIIPAGTVKVLQPDQFKWIQTLAFIIAAKFAAMGPLLGDSVKKILETIYCSFPGNDFGRELTFLDPDWWKGVVTRLDLAPLLVFVLHSGFLLAAIPLDGLQEPKCNLNDMPPGVAWNTHALAAKQLKVMGGM